MCTRGSIIVVKSIYTDQCVVNKYNQSNNRNCIIFFNVILHLESKFMQNANAN